MWDKPTDAQLVEKTLQGDMNAFGVLVDKYRGLVYGLAYHVVRSFQDAEDIAQDAFIKAYDSLSSLEDKTKFGSWLRVITLNMCKMWLRKSLRESLFNVSSLQNENDDGKNTFSFQDDLYYSSLVTDVTPEEICIKKEFQETVFKAISELPPKNQTVITLFYLDDFSYSEIADFLNLPVTTVQSRLQRARKQLKEEFLNMAKEIFQDNQLGPEFTQKVLDEIMEEGRRHWKADELKEAEEAFLKAIEIKPDYAEAHFYVALTKADQAEAHFRESSAKEGEKLYEEAAEWFQKAAELKPNYAQAYYKLALCLSDIDKDAMAVAYDKAITAYKNLLELNPDAPELYKEMGEAYTDKGDSKNGIVALKQAITLKPDYFEAYAYLGHAYQSKGDIEEAKIAYKKTTEIKVNPERFYDNPEAYRICMAYNNLGAIYLDEKDYDKAIFYMQKAIEKDRELGLERKIFQTNLAVAYAEKGADLAKKARYNNAVTIYKKAVNIFDELQRSPRYIKYRLSKGEHLAVIDAFEDFVSRNSEDAEAYYCLACLYSAKGDNSKASETLDKAVKLDPSYRKRAKMSRFFSPAKAK